VSPHSSFVPTSHQELS